MFRPSKDPDRRGPEALKDVIGRLFAARGWGRRQAQLRVEDAWASAAGPEQAAHTRVGRLQRGVLEIVVDSAVLLQELSHFHKRALLERLRKQLPTVKELRFRTGVIKKQD